MTNYTYLGGDFDLPAKKILLDIEDDDAFVTACSTNSAMRQICTGEDIWQERLKRYYPNTENYRTVLGLTWKEYYPLVSLWTQYAKVDALNPIQSQLQRLIKYLAKLNIDYQLLFKNEFTKLFTYAINNSVYLTTILKKLAGFFLDNNQLDKFRSLKWSANMTKYGDLRIRSRSMYYKLLKDHGSGTIIAQIIKPSQLIPFYESDGKMSEKKTSELFDILLPKLKQELYDNDNDDSIIEYENKIKELIPLTILKYNTKMTDKLFRDNPELDVSLVLTEYILSNVKSMDETPYSNCTEVIVYMTSRRIYPRFDLLLPTRTLFATEFFQILVSEINLDEIDEEVVFDTEIQRAVAQYKYLVQFKSIEEIIELFNVANMYPSLSVQADIPVEDLPQNKLVNITFE